MYSFTPLLPDDYPRFAAWLALPHVQKWWREPATVEHVAAEYGAPGENEGVYVMRLDGKPMGIIQYYAVDDYPEEFPDLGLTGAIGVDLFIGELELTGQGHGGRALAAFIDQVVRP